MVCNFHGIAAQPELTRLAPSDLKLLLNPTAGPRWLVKVPWMNVDHGP